MNKVFYGMAIVIAIILIVIASSVNRKKTTGPQNNTDSGSFNADQLHDAANKQPAP